MKRAFVLSEQGVCNVYFIRDEHPRIQWLIDLGVPNFTCFMLELPIPEDNPAHVQIVFNEGTALLLQQIQVFLSENEFGNDAGLLQSIMDAIHDTEIDYAGSDLMYGYEILFTLSSEFYQLVMNRLVKQKVAGREEDISKAVWRGPDTSKRVINQEWEKGMVQKRDKKQLEDAKSIINRYKQTIYKNTPGPLYVIMYDRNGMPRGVSRVTNRGLTKWAEDETIQKTHSITAAMTELPHDVEVKLPLYILTELTQKAQQFDPSAQFRFVGGCVRDMLLGRKPKDVDVVTNTTAQTLEQMGLQNVGKAFPVYLHQDEQYGQIEVAVARAEEKTGLGHKGFDTVPTGNFEDDVQRRDLNINAMMIDSDGKLYGPPQALEDIKSQTFDNVSEKFAEDPLRVFRVARFAAQFGDNWKVGEKLTNLMRQMQPELETLPADRIREECRRAMNGKNPIRFFEVLRDGDCIDPWFSELHSNWDGVAQSVQYGAMHHWGFEQQIVGLASQLTAPDTLINRLGLSDQIRRAAQYVKQNRTQIENVKRIPKADVVGLVQKGGRGVLDLDQLLACALLGTNSVAHRYLLKCQAAMQQADMNGVTGRADATERLVQAISKVAKIAMSVMEAVDEAAEQVHEELQRKPKPWQTPAFKQWFGNSKVVNRDGSPKQVMHGTTHDFDQFAPVNQNIENWYGGGYYFTDSKVDVSENYGTISGPDLTSRIEMLAEQIIDDYRDNNGEGHDFNPEEEIEGFDPDDDQAYGTPMYKALHDAAARKAKQMLAGRSTGHVIPVFLKIENPVIVSATGGTRLPCGDSGFNNPEDEDDYTEGEDDTRLYEAWENMCGSFDAWKAEDAWEQVSEKAMGGDLTALEFEQIVRQSEMFVDSEGGPGPAIAYFYDLMGYDGIIMDANLAFKNMKMSPGTRHYIVWDPKQIKSAIGNKGTWDPTSPLLTASYKMADDPAVDSLPVPSGHMPDYRVSPRMPKAPVVKYDQGGGIKPFKGQPREDAFAPKRLQPGLETMKNEPAKLKKNVDLMRQYPNFGTLDTDAAKAADQIIEMMKDNLVWLFEQWEEHRDRSKLWYVGGNELVHRWSKRFGLEPHQIAGVLAAMSPERPWFGNVTLAERFLVAMQRKNELHWDKKMSAILDGLNEKQSDQRANVEGKTLAEVEGPSEQDMWNMTLWIKCWDLAHNPRGCRVLTPEGNFGETWKTEKGRIETANVWKYFDHVIKSIKILRSGTLQDISNIIGQNHKVRSFYNNLIAPLDEEDVTIDTHAVAAALLRPLGTSDIEVTHNFGGKGTADSVSGSTGLYGLYAEAYRRAAKQMGVLPREMQSITWEAVRGLFKSSLKRSIKEQANAVWLAYTRGEADANATRLKIKDLGKGFDRPTWVGPHTTTVEETGDSSYEGKLSSLIRPRLRPEGVSGSGDRVFSAVRASDGSSSRVRSELLKTAGTLTLWHGGNLDEAYDESMAHRKGRWEYGPGLYLTTHWDTAQKYHKGSRKLYRVTITQGTDAHDVILPIEPVLEFIKLYVPKARAKDTVAAVNRFHNERGGLRADVFVNIMIDRAELPSRYSGTLRKFLVEQGVDYEIVDNAFGTNSRMVVLFNMAKILHKEVVRPKDKIEEFDLPNQFTASLLQKT